MSLDSKICRPEITEAMRRMDSALGSPTFPKTPLLDAMFALAALVGQHERQLGEEAWSTTLNVKAGAAQIPPEECKPLRLKPYRGPIKVNVAFATRSIQEKMGDVDPLIQLNLFANVLGQLCALEGVQTDFFQAVCEASWTKHGPTVES